MLLKLKYVVSTTLVFIPIILHWNKDFLQWRRCWQNRLVQQHFLFPRIIFHAHDFTNKSDRMTKSFLRRRINIANPNLLCSLCSSRARFDRKYHSRERAGGDSIGRSTIANAPAWRYHNVTQRKIYSLLKIQLRNFSRASPASYNATTLEIRFRAAAAANRLRAVRELWVYRRNGAALSRVSARRTRELSSRESEEYGRNLAVSVAPVPQASEWSPRTALSWPPITRARVCQFTQEFIAPFRVPGEIFYACVSKPISTRRNLSRWRK